MAHEGVEARLRDVDIEDAAAACGDGDGLHSVRGWVDDVAVDPGAVEDGPDDMEGRAQARAGGDDVEAGGVPGIASSPWG
jgi:hypothetical protein